MTKPMDGRSDDERTPLLDSVRTQEDTASVNEDATFSSSTSQRTSNEMSEPINLVQVLLLCTVGLAEPLAMFCIFPFINQMIFTSGNIKESDVGFWSGLIESLFAIVEMSVMVFYGRAADRIGRKPVLIFSLIGMGVTSSAFGSSKTIWQMVGFRCLGGLFAGSGASFEPYSVRTPMDREKQKRSAGGLLARPADVYPGLFRNVGLFRQFPYALPTMIAGALCFLAVLVSALFLRETLHRDPSVKDQFQATSTWEILKAPGVAAVLLLSGHIMFQAIGFQSTLLVAWFTSIDLCGFSFSERNIAIFMLIIAGSQAAYMLLVFPMLHRRFGTVGVLWGCAIAWPFTIMTFPLFNVFLRNGWNGLFWACASIIWPISSGVMMTIAAMQLCVRSVSPSKQTLATTNALAMTVNAGVKAISPAIFTSLWALGVRLQWLNGQFGFIVVIPFTALLPVTLLWLPETVKRENASKKVEDSS